MALETVVERVVFSRLFTLFLIFLLGVFIGYIWAGVILPLQIWGEIPDLIMKNFIFLVIGFVIVVGILVFAFSGAFRRR